MAATEDGDDITAGEVNHSESGTALICSPRDGHPGSDVILHVKPGLLLDSVDGIKGEGSRNGIVGTGRVGVVGDGSNTGVSGVGNLVGVLGRVNRSQAKLPPTFDNAGVQGSSFGDPLAAGVVGESDLGIGVYGVTTKGGVGVRGDSDSVGISGIGVSNIGVAGTSLGTGVEGNGGAIGVQGISDAGVGVVALANNSNLEALFAHNNGGGLAAFFLGGVRIQGNFTVFGGLKSAAVPHPDGSHRLLYCMESPESWFEDFGEANLVHGKAEVALPADFAATIHTDVYHVFLTPYGDSRGLFVANRNTTAFEVHEQQGGVSNLTFSYRIAARRRDVDAERLAKVSLPQTPEPTEALAPKEGTYFPEPPKRAKSE